MQNTKLAVVPAGKSNNFYRQNTVNQTEKNFYETFEKAVITLFEKKEAFKNFEDKKKKQER